MRVATLALGFSSVFNLAAFAPAQTLQIAYGTKGVQTLSYGATLEDMGAYQGDAFHIWHMKSTDIQGNVISAGQYGWGENNSGEAWNPATNTETYTFSWGSIATQFVQSGNDLNMIVTETNNAGSGIIFDGAEIYPFALHFPQDPADFYGYTQYVITTTGPGVSAADFGSGVVTSVIPNESVAMYGGWKTAGTATYTPIMTSTAPDGLAAFLPHNDVPVLPANSFTYTVSLRFTPEGTAANASDAYSSFAATYPNQMNWNDRRIIGTTYLASSPANNRDVTRSGGFPTNPRRYFNDPSVDITTPAGLEAFQDRILTQAATNVTDAQAMNGQGVITWDIEGEEYPQDTSYVCSPDQTVAVAPEMESAILDPTSPYFGQKLDDSYFKTMTAAGLRVGVCLRPQVFTLASNGTASQVHLTSNAAIISNLENKAEYANARWGATIFYVDSTVDTNGGTLDPGIFQQLINDLPSFLFIPEESTPRYYAYSAPFYSFIFQTKLGTDPSVYNYYPKAFGANLVNDVSAATLATYQPQLTRAVSSGDILMGLADYWQANDPTLVSIYAAAGVGTPAAPTPSAPTITWAAPSAVAYGAALSSLQLDAAANVAGTFVYSPAAGTVLGAGNNTLRAKFTPADTKDYTTAAASVPLTVIQATPAIAWSAPAGISYGTALSSNQLNATANVAGSLTYSPAAGTLPAIGNQILSVTFSPSDDTDYSSQTVTVPLVVNATTPAPTGPIEIFSPASGATVSGTIMVVGQCTLALDSAGTYLMVDGTEVGTRRVTSGPFVYSLDTTALTDGSHNLQLWGHDIGNNTWISTPVTVNVGN